EVLDIYSRVKRRKRRISSNVYETAPHVEESSNQSSLMAAVETNRRTNLTPKKEPVAEMSTDGESSEEQMMQRRYFLREQKSAPQRFNYNVEPLKKRMDVSPAHKRIKHNYSSRRRRTFRRKLENAGSSSTSDTDASNDEKQFERRLAKSLDRSRNRFLPLNMPSNSSKLNGISRQRNISTAIGADLDPMSIDTTVGFKDIGGLKHHLQTLKEMILFPLIYPEIFEKFKITPPRGVLFYGTPGTGKTLVARALANECFKGEKKVSIFFDEIDGLAPIRSSRQDQIHSSIVSTLLALMDGLDQRGEIIVIGATNRLDAIDPALRRPGRFDRELLFKLPDQEARCQILKIHTSDWNPPLQNDFIETLSSKLVGYCGADIKGLCTEAALIALRKKFPQIYASEKRLQVDSSAVTVTVQDFETAIHHLVPSTKRGLNSVSRQLPVHLAPLLSQDLDRIVSKINEEFKNNKINNNKDGKSVEFSIDGDQSYSDILDIFKKKKAIFGQKMILCASGAEHGQTTYLAPAVFHILDHLPVFSLSLPQIFSSNYRAAEEAVSEFLFLSGKVIRHRACSLRDVAYALIEEEYDSEFEQQCEEIDKFRQERELGESADLPPAFVYVAPINIQNATNSNGTSATNSNERRSVENGANLVNKKDPDRAAAIVKKYKATRRLNLQKASNVDLSGLNSSRSDISASNLEKETFFDSDIDHHQKVAERNSITPKPSVAFDRYKFNRLIDTAVSLTNDWPIRRIEKLYTKIVRSIERHAASSDKNSLIEELESVLRSL
uniref:AAA+ ATPase domain-containing protein n=1 Tax=Romanomermis culicivorax TaxID=13658 RepID=A0A915J9N5_ROMCU